MSKNMSVAVTVTVSVKFDSNGVATASATYAQGATDPGQAGSDPVVSSEGSINLQNLAYDKHKYKLNTDITWNFTFPALPAGTISVLNPAQDAIVIQPYDQKMNAGRDGTANQIALQDQGKADASYTYALLLAYQPPTGLPQIIMLDPPIVNRGGGT